MRAHFVFRSLQAGEPVEYRGRPARVAGVLTPFLYLILGLILQSLAGNVEPGSVALG